MGRLRRLRILSLRLTAGLSALLLSESSSRTWSGTTKSSSSRFDCLAAELGFAREDLRLLKCWKLGILMQNGYSPSVTLLTIKSPLPTPRRPLYSHPPLSHSTPSLSATLSPLTKLKRILYPPHKWQIIAASPLWWIGVSYVLTTYLSPPSNPSVTMSRKISKVVPIKKIPPTSSREGLYSTFTISCGTF